MGTSRERVVVVGSTAASVVLFVWLSVVPLTRRLADVNHAVLLAGARWRQHSAEASEVFRHGPELLERRAAMEGASDRIPADARVGDVLERLSEAASAARLRNEQMTPRGRYTIESIGVIPIEMTFESTFSSLYAFLEGIESLDRVVRVRRIETTRERDLSAALKTQLELEAFFDPREGV